VRTHLSRVAVYGDCVICHKECVGDSTRELYARFNYGVQFIGYAHPACDPSNKKEGK
jgi:hypothetical protein